jgi:hypothetical protein
LEGFTVLTILSSGPICRKWERGTVTLRHATPWRNLASILRDGILTAKARGHYKAVWLHALDRSHWAALHCVRRHGGRIEDVVVLEVCVPKAWLKAHGGRVGGIWRSVRDIPPKYIRRVINFEELSRSPVEQATAAS